MSLRWDPVLADVLPACQQDEHGFESTKLPFLAQILHHRDCHTGGEDGETKWEDTSNDAVRVFGIRCVSIGVG